MEASDFSNIKLFYVATDRNQSAGCGGQLYSTWGFFMNPIEEYEQRNYSNCRWDVQVPTMNQISLQFGRKLYSQFLNYFIIHIHYITT